jgi:hypothetical protein
MAGIDSDNKGGWDELWKALNTPIGDLPDKQSEFSQKALDARTGSVEPNQAQRSNLPEGYRTAAAGKRSNGGKRSSGSKSQYGTTNSSTAKQSGKTPDNKPKKQRRIKQDRYHQRSESTARHTHCVFGETTNRIGFHSGENSPPIALAASVKAEKGEKLYRPGFLTLLFGVILPVAAVLAEVNTHVMAQSYFDPFPTQLHTLLFLLIPLSNFLSWLAVRKNIVPLYSTMSLCSGMALGIAVLYSVMLLPVIPKFMESITSGFGLLGLSPVISIPITLLCGITICQLSDRQKTFFDAHQLKHLGHLIVLVMVIAVELPSTLTRYQLSQTDNAATEKQAVQWLRQWGNRDTLLRACYERSGEATDILGSIAEHQHPISVNKARAVYYQVTGVAFNSVPIPASFRGTIKNSGTIVDPSGLNDGVRDEFDLDPDIAGELVSGVARGLSVSDSSIKGTLDSANGVAILDWDFTFQNVSSTPREARAKILLPPNAVVTRATLWLADFKADTVIKERGLARQTYQASIMNQQKDPLLVSMSGQDSVLVQCYPVVKNQLSKIQLHIVSPLLVSGKNEESLSLPTFEERNFAITIPHDVTLTGNTKISIAGSDVKTSEEKGKFVSHATLDNALLSRFSAVPKLAIPAEAVADELTVRPPESNAQARQAFYSQLPEMEFGSRYDRLPLIDAGTKNKSLTILVDKSITMAPYMNEIISALKAAPKNIPITLIDVKDGFNQYCDRTNSDDKNFQTTINKFAEVKCDGGQSDAEALESIFMKAPAERGAVLWIHAAQPVVNSYETYMREQLATAKTTALYDLQVASGPNAILPESYNFPALSRVVRSGSLSSDITTFLNNFANDRIRKCATTFGVRKESALPEVAQVQAYKLALARYQGGDKYGAYELATRYHLVTPVSSAVVDVSEVARNELAKPVFIQLSKTGRGLPESVPSATPAAPPVVPYNNFYNTGAKADSSRHDKEASLKDSRPWAESMSETRFYNAPRTRDLSQNARQIDSLKGQTIYEEQGAALEQKQNMTLATPARSMDFKAKKAEISSIYPGGTVLAGSTNGTVSSPADEPVSASKEGGASSDSGSMSAAISGMSAGAGGSFGDSMSSQSVDGSMYEKSTDDSISDRESRGALPLIAPSVCSAAYPQIPTASPYDGAHMGMKRAQSYGTLFFALVLASVAVVASAFFFISRFTGKEPEVTGNPFK